MTEPVELPAEVRRLLAGAIGSIEKVELVLLAWQAPESAWTVAQAAERLRLPEEAIAVALDELAVTGLLVATGAGYRFAPVLDDDREAVVALCRIYQADRLLVLKEMTALAMDRIRNSAARVFAVAIVDRNRRDS